MFGRWAPPTRSTTILATAGAVVILISLLVNRNLFYLSSLYAFLVFVVSVIPAKKGKLVIFILFVMLSLTSAKVKEPKILHVRDGLEFFSFDSGVSRSYAFSLTDFIERQRECGPAPVDIFIQGKDLGALDVAVSGATIRSRKMTRFYGYAHLDISLANIDPNGVEVRLRSNGDATPAIFTGPEVDPVDGFDIYPHAVYIIVENSSCRMIYHAKPRPASYG